MKTVTTCDGIVNAIRPADCGQASIGHRSSIETPVNNITTVSSDKQMRTGLTQNSSWLFRSNIVRLGAKNK